MSSLATRRSAPSPDVCRPVRRGSERAANTCETQPRLAAFDRLRVAVVGDATRHDGDDHRPTLRRESSKGVLRHTVVGMDEQHLRRTPLLLLRPPNTSWPVGGAMRTTSQVRKLDNFSYDDLFALVVFVLCILGQQRHSGLAHDAVPTRVKKLAAIRHALNNRRAHGGVHVLARVDRTDSLVECEVGDDSVVGAPGWVSRAGPYSVHRLGPAAREPAVRGSNTRERTKCGRSAPTRRSR